MKCQNCGAELKPGAQFCEMCGIKIQPVKRFCKNCGAELTEDMLFCSNCGTKKDGVEDSSVSRNVDSFVADKRDAVQRKYISGEYHSDRSQASLYSAKEATPNRSVNFFSSDNNSFNHQQAKPKKKKRWILIVATLLIFAGIVSPEDSGDNKAPETSKNNNPDPPIVETQEPVQTQRNGFDSAANEVYTFGEYTIEIPKYWNDETQSPNGIVRYAETNGKVAILQLDSMHYSEPMSIEAFLGDNKAIEEIESNVFKKVTNYEVIDAGQVKGILYKGTIESSGYTGNGFLFMFPAKPGNDWHAVIYAQTDNTKYLYDEDYMKMLSSIKIVDVSNETGNEQPPEEMFSSEDTTELESPSEETSDPVTRNAPTDEPIVAEITVDDLDVDVSFGNSHARDTVITLGNKESATISVTVPGIGFSADDILVVYDDTLLSVECNELLESGNVTIFKYFVTGKKTCETEIAFLTAYDFLTKGEDAEGLLLNVNKLNSTDGKVCYITPTGEKYHYSKACAGKNAIKTTCYDAIQMGYDPCKKCAH